ncbi:unnamed protein product [Arabidopsis halleri]
MKKLESSLKFYALESAPTIALNAQIEKTKRRTSCRIWLDNTLMSLKT